jgi:hypothetical protein
MKTDDDEYDDEDLGVFILDKHCAEIEQIIKGVGYCLLVVAVCVPVIAVYVFLV